MTPLTVLFYHQSTNKKMIIITPTESNNNHPNLKDVIGSESFTSEPCLKLEMITLIGLPQ